MLHAEKQQEALKVRAAEAKDSGYNTNNTVRGLILGIGRKVEVRLI